jgi:hypothetical protein
MQKFSIITRFWRLPPARMRGIFCGKFKLRPATTGWIFYALHRILHAFVISAAEAKLRRRAMTLSAILSGARSERPLWERCRCRSATEPRKSRLSVSCRLSYNPASAYASREGRRQPEFGKLMRQQSMRAPTHPRHKRVRASVYRLAGKARGSCKNKAAASAP